MNNRDAIFVIESLRSGIPTRRSTRLLPDIRESVSSQIISDLTCFDDNIIPAGRIIWGQYGQGKTHALTAIEHLALDRNFAVSRISLSREVSCHNLFHFYSQIAPRVKTPESTLEGIQHHLNRMQPAEIGQSVLFSEDRYVNALPLQVLDDYYFAEGEDKEKLYGDLMGTRLPVSELGRIHRVIKGSALPKFKFKVTEHTSAYFGLLADLIQLCGFEGWVILIDEVELIGRLGKISRYKAYRNLNWLLNWQGTMKYPVYTIAAAATRLQDDLWYGKANDDRTVMPELAQMRFGDEAACEMEHFFTRAIDDAALKILPAQQSDLIELLDAITRLHGEAYQWSASLSSSNLINQLGAQPVRTYIRAALEYLDLEYLYGQTLVPETDRLMEADLTETGEEEPDFETKEQQDDNPGYTQA
ncbi:MAG: BREX system ATP-binding domain-containing protein [Bacillota bacterium]|nr:BREX system ATP-binding domain-containing protein [Bacillota bacterium]